MTNPFEKLAGLRDQLPPGPKQEEPKQASPKEPKRFGPKVIVRKERKGRGGKTVTLVEGVLPHAREQLAAEMKRALGCGARIEGESIVLQGDLVERAKAFLDAKTK
jgi:translation initiation factor 1